MKRKYDLRSVGNAFSIDLDQPIVIDVSASNVLPDLVLAGRHEGARVAAEALHHPWLCLPTSPRGRVLLSPRAGKGLVVAALPIQSTIRNKLKTVYQIRSVVEHQSMLPNSFFVKSKYELQFSLNTHLTNYTNDSLA
jgi:hypothetical protein